MSSSDPQNKQPVENRLNSYIYMFVGFVIVISIAFLIMHTVSSKALSATSKEESKPEEAVVTKNIPVETKQKLLKDTSGDYYLGEKFAPVVVIEYASLACPHCKELQETVIEPMIANYVDKGKVKYIFRDFPHNEAAFPAAILTHCADPDKYYSFVKVLFKSQDQWAYSDNYLTTLKWIGKMGGVSPEKFDKCQNDKEMQAKVLSSVKNATDILEVHSVPTIYINGNLYDGKRNYNDVAAYIDKQLKGE